MKSVAEASKKSSAACKYAFTILLSPQLRLLKVKGDARALTGYSPKELEGVSLSYLAPRKALEELKETLSALEEGECAKRPLPLKTKEGSLKRFYCLLRRRGESFLCLLADATEEELLKESYFILKEAANRILKSSEEEEVLAGALEAFVKHGEASCCGAVVRQKEGLCYPVKAVGDKKEELLYALEAFLKERGENCLILKALRENRIVLVEEVKKSSLGEEVKERLTALGIRSLALLPLYGPREPAGVLLLFSPYKKGFGVLYEKVLSELKATAEFALEEIERDRLAQVCMKTFQRSHFPMALLDEELRFLRVNESFASLLRLSEEELKGRPITDFLYGESPPPRLLKRGVKAFPLRLKVGDQHLLLDAAVTPVSHGGKTFYSLLAKDITYEKELERRVLTLSRLDQKTGALNRESFLKEVERLIEKSPDRYHLLLVVDVRNFSEINRVYGHSAGDEVLKALFERLKKIPFGKEVAGRLGADEFGLFFTGVQLSSISSLLNRVLQELKKPFNLKGEELSLSFNAGASVYPYDGRSAEELLQKAYVALKRAKEEGENAYKFFSAKFQEESEHYLKVRRLLSEALAENRLKLFYQPIYSCAKGELAGYEGLVRIVKGEEVVPPSRFIELLERSELSLQVDLGNLSRAREFFYRKAKGKFVSLNVSPKSFKDSRFLKALEELPPDFRSHLVLEITERILLEDLSLSKEVLQWTDRLGVKVFIDDFGTGYSSFSYLDELPVHGLKIEAGFVRKLGSPKTRSLVKTLLSLGRELGLTVVAEGVEKKEQWEVLKSLRCELVQGFYFSPPLPEEKL